jgi:hypothetical protein
MTVPYKLEPFDIYVLKSMSNRRHPGKNYIKRDVVGIVEEFVRENYDCCIVCECNTEREAHIETCIIRRAINMHDYVNVKTVQRGKTVYMVKKNVWEKTK